MKKNLTNISPTLTIHGIGEKRVLLANDETPTLLTQIAITKLKAGEESDMHKHPTMEEYFLIRKGKVIVNINNQQTVCETDDFIKIPTDTLHSLRAITDTEILTIGCAMYS